jgi:hypothetical protein
VIISRAIANDAETNSLVLKRNPVELPESPVAREKALDSILSRATREDGASEPK